jgi:hypothetical protein
VKCSITHGQGLQRKEFKAKKKANNKAKKEFYDNDRATVTAKTQKSCNEFIRARDKHLGCVSCDKPSTWQGQWHASHYRPSGNNSALRFHEMNIHKSCSECNNFKSGNLTPYRIVLIDKIGLSNVEYLENHNELYKWTLDDLKEITQYYKDKLKALA